MQTDRTVRKACIRRTCGRRPESPHPKRSGLARRLCSPSHGALLVACSGEQQDHPAGRPDSTRGSWNTGLNPHARHARPPHGTRDVRRVLRHACRPSGDAADRATIRTSLTGAGCNVSSPGREVWMKRMASVPQPARDGRRRSPGSRQDISRMCLTNGVSLRPHQRRASSLPLPQSESRAEKGMPA